MEENSPKAIFDEGMSLIAKGQPGDAMEHFKKLIEMGNKNPSCYSWLGIAMARSESDFVEAEECCKLALQMDRTKPQYFLNLAEVYILRGFKDKAIETLKAGLKVDKGNEAILSELAKIEETNPKAIFEEGMSLIAKGQPGDAMERFEKLIDMGYKNPSCYSWLGITMARSKWDLAEAEKCCKLALKMDNSRPQFYLNLAEVYTLKGLTAKAIDTLKAGLKVDKRNRAILTELAKFGIRRRPPIPFLSRGNFVNKHVGLFLAKMGLR